MRGQRMRFVAAGSVACACLLGSLALSPAARADETLTFSYNDGTDPAIGGVLEGDQSGDYFTVTAVDSLTSGGTAVSLTPTVIASLDAVLADNPTLGYYGNGLGVVTLDGSYMDLIVSDSNINDGFAFGAGDGFATFETGYPVVVGGALFGSYEASFVAGDWTATVDAPEPMSAAILGVALSGLVAARKRRAARKAN